VQNLHFKITQLHFKISLIFQSQKLSPLFRHFFRQIKKSRNFEFLDKSGCGGKTRTYDLRVMSKARKVLVNLVLNCICWYIWCAQFFDFVNLCDFGSFLVSCVPILSPIILINLWRS